MSPQKAILGIALIFFLGIITGVGLSIRLIKVRTHAIASGTPQELGRIVAMRLSSELKLSPQQRMEVQKSATGALLKLRELHTPPAGESEEIERQSRREIEAILTPAQKLMFEESALKIFPAAPSPSP